MGKRILSEIEKRLKEDKENRLKNKGISNFNFTGVVTGGKMAKFKAIVNGLGTVSLIVSLPNLQQNTLNFVEFVGDITNKVGQEVIQVVENYQKNLPYPYNQPFGQPIPEDVPGSKPGVVPYSGAPTPPGPAYQQVASGSTGATGAAGGSGIGVTGIVGKGVVSSNIKIFRQGDDTKSA